MNDCSFIILGGTGDLAKRKLIPAMYRLMHDKKIEKFIFVGAALDDISGDEFIERGYSFIRNPDQVLWDRLKAASYYYKLDFNQQRDFVVLNDALTVLEKKHGLSGNRIFYLATPSYYFCDITQHLGSSGLVKKAGTDGMHNGIWQRIVYEKPFGLDLTSALAANACITSWFNENQIYRIDHYLTKELVSNIVLVRFTNIILEPLWNKQYIDYVEIIMTETIGLEGRGRYYDSYGILKDVVQNHVMQLIALIAMELPETLTAHAIRDEKAKVLKKISVVDGLLGQYDGYKQEQNVATDSTTPTFACLRLFVDTPRWQGVPFYVKAGKRLSKKDTSIHIKFKNVDCTIKESCVYESDYLSIQIEPDASFSLQLNTKQPGAMYEVVPVSLTFSHNYVFRSLTPEAYEVLLERIMLGDQYVSVRFDEIEYAWIVIDTIQKLNLPLYFYKQLSVGPEEIKAFDKKYKVRWRA